MSPSFYGRDLASHNEPQNSPSSSAGHLAVISPVPLSPSSPYLLPLSSHIHPYDISRPNVLQLTSFRFISVKESDFILCKKVHFYLAIHLLLNKTRQVSPVGNRPSPCVIHPFAKTNLQITITFKQVMQFQSNSTKHPLTLNNTSSHSPLNFTHLMIRFIVWHFFYKKIIK